MRWIVGTKSHKGLTTAFDFLPFHLKQVPKVIMTSPMLGETIRHGLIYHPPPSVGHQRRFWNLRANLWFPCLWLPILPDHDPFCVSVTEAGKAVVVPHIYHVPLPESWAPAS